MRGNPSLHQEIVHVAKNHAWIFAPKSVKALHDELNRLAEIAHPNGVCVHLVGGDGTFHVVTNWLMTHPKEHNLVLSLVGGGQFNFMTKFVGLPSMNPAVNLEHIFCNRVKTVIKPWYPIAVHDSQTDTKKFCAVMANGVISDTVRLYQRAGKGGIIPVARVVLKVIVNFFKHVWMHTPPLVDVVPGRLRVNGNQVPATHFAGVVVSSVNEFVTHCRPFKQNIADNTCGVIAYWGGLGRLALSVPFVWTGSKSPLTDPFCLNRNASFTTFETDTAAMIMDGDLVDWPSQQPPTTRRFTCMRAEQSIRLLCVSSS